MEQHMNRLDRTARISRSAALQLLPSTTARLACVLWAFCLLLVFPVLAAADSAGEAVDPVVGASDTGRMAELTALASFAEAFIAWDLEAARGFFAPDAEVFHHFDDGRVVRV